jgi:hypothetical protein
MFLSDRFSACALNELGYPGQFAFNLGRSQRKACGGERPKTLEITIQRGVLPVFVVVFRM